MKLSFSKILPKGSVLVFSLIILSVMLVMSLMLLSSAVLDQKASLSTANSTRSFQVADSGAEQVLYQIYKGGAGTIDNIASGIGLSCDDGTISDASSGWTVRFYDVDGNRLSDCDESRDNIVALKSEGSAQGTVRAVEVAVAQASSDYFSEDGHEVTGLNAGKTYFVSVYGFLDYREGGGNKSIYPVKVTDCSDGTLDETFSGTVTKNYPDGEAPNNASLIVTVPADGCIRGYTDREEAYHMTGFSLD